MFTLGSTSLSRLAGVHGDLVRVVKRAIAISTQDFGVSEGIRSSADQLRDWQRHASKLNGIPIGQTVAGVRGTGRGNHQVAEDGFGHAVDLVPYVGGIILWSLPENEQWPHIYPVATAMRNASIIENIAIRWGGVWDRVLAQLGPGDEKLKAEVEAYTVRHAGPDFMDGPHFELHAPAS